jgi:seryl-tRNA synthetase
MLDPHLLRSSLQEVADKLATRGFQFDLQKFSALEAVRKTLQIETQALQNERNIRAKAIGMAKSKGEDCKYLL